MRSSQFSPSVVGFGGLVLLGAGGQADEIAFYSEEKEIIRTVDHQFLNGDDLICLDHGAKELLNHKVLVAVGAPYVKKLLAKKWQGDNWTTVISKDAVIAQTSTLDYGCVAAPRVVIMPKAIVGKHVHLNTASVVSHGTQIGDFSTVSPGVLIGGNCRIGEGVFIGMGAIIKDGVTIGSGATVGAGAVVIDNVSELEVVVGNPARVIDTRTTWFADF